MDWCGQNDPGWDKENKMKLVLKVDENGNVVVVDGKIIYVDEDADGKEYPLDPPALYSKVSELGKENKMRREKVTEIEAKYLSLADIEDIEQWKKDAEKAIETVKNYNDKDLIDAGKVEKMKEEMKDAYEAKISALKDKAKVVAQAHADALSGKDREIRTLMISNRFSISPHFNGDESITTMPPDVAEAFFGSNFKVESNEEGEPKLKAYLGGEEIMSLQNPGDPADFEEAISIIIDKYPNKDHILRAPGGGSGGGGGQGGGGSPQDERTKLNKQLEAAQKPAAEGGDPGLAIAIKNKIANLDRK